MNFFAITFSAIMIGQQPTEMQRLIGDARGLRDRLASLEQKIDAAKKEVQQQPEREIKPDEHPDKQAEPDNPTSSVIAMLASLAAAGWALSRLPTGKPRSPIVHDSVAPSELKPADPAFKPTEYSFKIGAILPVESHDAGNFRLNIMPDGSTKTVVRFAAHFNGRMAAVLPPDSVDYAAKGMESIKQMLGNDRAGDCVIASKLHAIGIWSGNDTGNPVLSSTQEALNQYRSICGPGDNGCVISDVEDHFRDSGLIAGGKTHKIDGYVHVDNTNKLEVKTATYLFGGLTLGIDLPQGWYDSADVWDTHNGNTQTIGGHDVRVIDYGPSGVRVATWAGIRTITWDAFMMKRWITECYAELGQDWYGDDQLAPSGVDKVTLSADLQLLGGGNVPPLPDPVTPPVNPPITPPVGNFVPPFSLWVNSIHIPMVTFSDIASAVAMANMVYDAGKMPVDVKDSKGQLVQTIPSPVPVPPNPNPVPPGPHSGATITLSVDLKAGSYEVLPAGTRAKFEELRKILG